MPARHDFPTVATDTVVRRDEVRVDPCGVGDLVDLDDARLGEEVEVVGDELAASAVGAAEDHEHDLSADVAAAGEVGDDLQLEFGGEGEE